MRSPTSTLKSAISIQTIFGYARSLWSSPWVSTSARHPPSRLTSRRSVLRQVGFVKLTSTNLMHFKPRLTCRNFHVCFGADSCDCCGASRNSHGKLSCTRVFAWHDGLRKRGKTKQTKFSAVFHMVLDMRTICNQPATSKSLETTVYTVNGHKQ